MRTIAALILIALTIALPVTTMSVQHYHFHYGEDEESRGLRNLGQLPALNIPPGMHGIMAGQKRRLSGWNRWQKRKYHRSGNHFRWGIGYSQYKKQGNYVPIGRRTLSSVNQLQNGSRHRMHDVHAIGSKNSKI